MYDKYGQFIDGKWQKSASGETYDVINPATEELIGKASKANSSDVQKALKSAEKGLEIWRNTSPWERSKIIRKISELIRQRVDILSKWLTLEVGKPLTEGPGEVGGAADIFEWNSEETKRIFGEIERKDGREIIEVSFYKGDSIKIINGPFIDFNGVIDEINEDKQKVKVIVSIFGRPTPVELDFFQVEKYN